MDTIIHQFAESQVSLSKIGQGFCGTVWAEDHENYESHDHHDEHFYLVLKREDGGPGRSILHEYQIHEQLLQTIQNASNENIGKFQVNFPFCGGPLTRDSPHWPRILPRLPSNFEACNALVNEKIPSMPSRVRTLLFNTYHPEATGFLTAAIAINDYCLVRPYLGRHRYRQQMAASRARPGRLVVFSLRNFPLYLDQIEQLSLPAKEYAIAMADALAFLYWTAKVDANDVEFVLAPARRSSEAVKFCPGIGSVKFQSEAFGTHVMWALDFDCCKDMAMDETGVKQAVRSFLRNDPFYPKPPSGHNTTTFDEQL